MLNKFTANFPQLLPITDKNLEKNLQLIGYSSSLSAYVSFAAIVSILLVPLLLVACNLLDFPNYFAIIAAIICFESFLFYPQLQKQRIQNELDARLPLAAQLVSADLATHSNREDIIASMRESFPTQIEKLSKILRKGYPLNIAVEYFDSPSTNFKSFVKNVAHSPFEEFEKYSNELIEEQKNKYKIFQAKSNLLGMIFISVSAILPAFFSALVLLANLLQFAITPLQVLFCFAIVFPAIDLLFIYYLESNAVNW